MAGATLLSVILLAPHPGQDEGRSFFAVAMNCTWRQLGEWASAWCSVKIMMLGAGTLCLLVSAWALATALAGREVLEWTVFFLALAPLCCLTFGFYFLIKAVL